MKGSVNTDSFITLSFTCKNSILLSELHTIRPIVKSSSQGFPIRANFMNPEKIDFRQCAVCSRSSEHDALMEESDKGYEWLNCFADLPSGEILVFVSTNLSLHEVRKFSEGMKCVLPSF